MVASTLEPRSQNISCKPCAGACGALPPGEEGQVPGDPAARRRVRLLLAAAVADFDRPF